MPSHKELFRIHTVVHQFKALKSNAILTLTKMNIMHDFTHSFAFIFQPTIVSAHSRYQQGLFKVHNEDECKGMVI